MTNIIASIALTAVLLAGCRERPPNQSVLIKIPGVFLLYRITGVG